MAKEDILLEKRDGVAIISFNRPEVLNGLTFEMGLILIDMAKELGQDKSVRSVILTGVGRAYSAGGDLGLIKAWKTPEDVYRDVSLVGTSVEGFVNLEKPVITAVNGPAVGAGLNFALAGDIIIASETATFSEIFAKIGLVPDGGGLYSLVRRVGLARAKELVFTARMLTAQEAESIGLINKVVPADQLMEEAWKLARQFAEGPTIAYGLAKRGLNQSLACDMKTLVDLEGKLQGIVAFTEDHKEGLKAFAEKRAPKFTGN